MRSSRSMTGAAAWAGRLEEASVALTARYYTAMAAGRGAAGALGALYAQDAVRPTRALAGCCSARVTASATWWARTPAAP